MARVSSVPAVVLVAFVLVGCGGGGSGGQGTDGTTITSADGVVSVTLPSGMADPGVTIAPVPELSPAVAAAADEGWTGLEYDLGPDGTQFDDPVTVTFNLDPADFGLASGELPLAVLVSGSGNDFEGYADMTIERTDDAVTVSGPATHFSHVAVLIGGVTATMTPSGASADVTFYFHVKIDVPGMTEGSDLIQSMEYDFFGASPYLSVPEDASGTMTASKIATAGTDIRCVQETPANTLVEYGAELRLINSTALPQVGPIPFREVTSITGRIVGLAICDPLGGPTSSTSSTFGSVGGGIAIQGGVATTATDPTGDFIDETVLTEERGFKLVEQNPPAGLDITETTVEYDPEGDLTVVTIKFAGDAKALEDQMGREVTIRAIFDKDGEEFFEAYYTKGTIYISGGSDSQEFECSYEWLSNDTIRFTIEGYSAASGDKVRIRSFSRYNQGSGPEAQGDELDMILD